MYIMHSGCATIPGIDQVSCSDVVGKCVRTCQVFWVTIKGYGKNGDCRTFYHHPSSLQSSLWDLYRNPMGRILCPKSHDESEVIHKESRTNKKLKNIFDKVFYMIGTHSETWLWRTQPVKYGYYVHRFQFVLAPDESSPAALIRWWNLVRAFHKSQKPSRKMKHL